MLAPILCYLIYSILVSGSDGTAVSEKSRDFDAALRFLDRYNDELVVQLHYSSLAMWNYDNNLTDYNRIEMLKEEQRAAAFSKRMWKEAVSYDWKEFKSKSESVYRAFKQISTLGAAALEPGKLNKLNAIIADMSNTYAVAKVCPYKNGHHLPCNLSIEPELTELMKIPGNYDELAYYWVQWRDNTGKKCRGKYLEMVSLTNEAARLNGFPDASEYQKDAYERSVTFEEDIENLWQTLKPLYDQLHAYVRKNLRRTYGEHIKPDGPIPAQLLGNMWAQTWDNIFPLVNPYPEKSAVDVTNVMLERKMTPLGMFKTSEEFFVSLGLIPMTKAFWENSVIEKPTDREIICHASAWDLSYKGDVRIKMCTRVNQEDLITVHHEMGHIEYFLQYENQSTVFREGSNPGFHEAIGDTLALSVSTPSHLNKIGLLEKVEEDEEVDINFLLSMALKKIAFLPFGYLIDAYRWRIFNGSIKPEELNYKWHELRLKYQGICPPVLRNEFDFDAGSKYHVVADVEYIRYFISYVIQFQFHKALCHSAGYEGPLHKCDIYQSHEAGKLLSKMLSLGSSVHWSEAMEVITQGQTSKMEAGPLMEYFSPLMRWLEKENKNEYIGWKSDNPMICP